MKSNALPTISHTNRLVLGFAFATALSTASWVSAQEPNHPPRGEAAFAELDTNDDGTINFEEFSARGGEMISRLDSDGDGALSLDEFMSGRQGRGTRGDMPRGQNQQAQGQRELTEEQLAKREERRAMMEERRAMMQENVQQRFVAIDTNGDEKISAGELLEANFLNLDADNNGALTQEELRPRGGRGMGRGDSNQGHKQGQNRRASGH